jgi:uncharacterized protein YeeX (DUF496 family)
MMPKLINTKVKKISEAHDSKSKEWKEDLEQRAKSYIISTHAVSQLSRTISKMLYM